MKKYKYKLESILKLRKFEEYQVRVKLGEINSKIALINNSIVDYQQYISEIFALQQKELEQKSEGGVLTGYAYTLESYRNKIMELEKEKKKLLLESGKIREKLLEKKNKVKTFEQMKEKNYLRFKKEEDSKEESEIEEINQNLFIYSRKQN